MRRILIRVLLSVSLSVAAGTVLSAQTDYDIRVFLDNINSEKPVAEDLQFYLSAGKKLLNEGRPTDAAVFFDYAASLGSREGFRGKALTAEPGPSRARYECFAESSSDGAARLLSALLNARTDLSAALLVHANMDVYSLVSLRDPLIEWMPSQPSDTAFLRKNDSVAYMIAKTKEDAGNRFGALLIYEIAAWEGNYEALKKASVIGSFDERTQKEALVKRMEKNKKGREYLYLHKYFAGEKLTCAEYSSIASLFVDPSEKLVALALGAHEPVYTDALDKQDHILTIIVALINSKGDKRPLTKEGVISSIQKYGYKPVLEELQKRMGKMSDRESDLFFDLKIAERNLQRQDVSANKDYKLRLKDYIKTHPKNQYSPEAISFIRKYYKETPLPWADEIMEIVKQVPVDKKAKYTGTNNIYYPLYQRGLFSRLHHTEDVVLNRIDIGL